MIQTDFLHELMAVTQKCVTFKISTPCLTTAPYHLPLYSSSPSQGLFNSACLPVCSDHMLTAVAI